MIVRAPLQLWLERSRNHQGYGPVGLWTKEKDPFSRAMTGVDLPTQDQLNGIMLQAQNRAWRDLALATQRAKLARIQPHANAHGCLGIHPGCVGGVAKKWLQHARLILVNRSYAKYASNLDDVDSSRLYSQWQPVPRLHPIAYGRSSHAVSPGVVITTSPWSEFWCLVSGADALTHALIPSASLRE